jgi:hypothetical protein
MCYRPRSANILNRLRAPLLKLEVETRGESIGAMLNIQKHSCARPSYCCYSNVSTFRLSSLSSYLIRHALISFSSMLSLTHFSSK